MNYEKFAIPNSFSETVQLVEKYALEEIKQEAKAKQLYYHTVNHAIAVKRRANTIFQAVRPYLDNSNILELNRIAELIKLGAVAHDLVQEIIPATEANTSRKRPPKVSEFATIDKLTQYINNLNQALLQYNIDDVIKFSALDIQIITEAIAATICELDPLAEISDSIYQPYLYRSSPKISWVANIIALADLGTLGMEGAETYLHEGILIFLEENPDLVELITTNRSLNILSTSNSDRHRNIIKKRLLKMTRFMVNLARDRQSRFQQEITAFPEAAQNILQHQVFVYLNNNTINRVKQLTPTDEQTSLAEILAFFHYGWQI